MIFNLEKKYNKKFNLEELTEKDIIFFCRDNLNYYNSENNRVIYEKEILNLIKTKEWNWSVKDIDQNNILLYPVHNNAFTIVSYLIENKKYDLKKYDSDISKALCSSIMPIGEKMNQYLLSQDIHKEYISDMIFHAYNMSVSKNMKEEFVFYYKEKAQNLLKQDLNFNKIFIQFLSLHEFSNHKNNFQNFLESHPLDIEEKLLIVKNFLKENKSLSVANKEKSLILNNWIIYIELNKRLKLKQTPNKKHKI